MHLSMMLFINSGSREVSDNHQTFVQEACNQHGQVGTSIVSLEGTIVDLVHTFIIVQELAFTVTGTNQELAFTAAGINQGLVFNVRTGLGLAFIVEQGTAFAVVQIVTKFIIIIAQVLSIEYSIRMIQGHPCSIEVGTIDFLEYPQGQHTAAIAVNGCGYLDKCLADSITGCVHYLDIDLAVIDLG